MNDDRRAVMASTFRAWWQSLADQDPDEIAAGNSLDARRLWSDLVAIGKRNGVVMAAGNGDPSASSWAELTRTSTGTAKSSSAPTLQSRRSSAQPASLTTSRWHDRYELLRASRWMRLSRPALRPPSGSARVAAWSPLLGSICR